MGRLLSLDDARALRATEQIAVHGSCGPGREQPDPFAIGHETEAGSRQTAESAELARAMLQRTPFEASTTAVARYLHGFAYVPPVDMHALHDRGMAIAVAPGIMHVVESEWANRRRGHPLRAGQQRTWEQLERRSLAIYEAALDLIICPLAPLEDKAYGRLDREYPAVHEVGHALTYHAAFRTAPYRADLLEGLTPAIARHVNRYPQGSSPAAVRERVLEALAEAYRLMIAGCDRHVPRALSSALLAILQGDGLPAARSDAA